MNILQRILRAVVRPRALRDPAGASDSHSTTHNSRANDTTGQTGATSDTPASPSGSSEPDLERLIKAVEVWQAAGYVHPLTCGIDSGHDDLVPVIDGGIVFLRCPHKDVAGDFDCPWEQDLDTHRGIAQVVLGHLTWLENYRRVHGRDFSPWHLFAVQDATSGEGP